MEARNDMQQPHNSVAPTRDAREPSTSHGDRLPVGADPGELAPSHAELQGLPLADNLVDWLGILRRQWLLIAAVWIVVMSLTVVALYYWPRSYESAAKFLVRNQRQELVVGPNASTATLYRDQVSEEVLNTELELLRSRDILTRVVRELDLDRGLIAQGKSPEIARQLAVQGLGTSLIAAPIRKTSIVRVSYTSQDPVLAAAVVQHVADAYLAAHLAMHGSPGTYEMFKSQADAASAELRAAEEELAALARSSNLVMLDTQKEEALKSVQGLTAEINSLGAEIREQETRARIAELHMSRTPERVSTDRRTASNQASVEHLHTMIVELNNKRTEALTKFQPTDRLVVELDKQIADTRAALGNAETRTGTDEATGINPAWQSLDAERMKARLQLAGLESKSQQLKHELEEQRNRTLQITEAGPQYDELERRVSGARNRYELFAKKQEEARIAEVLDRQRISNVVLAQAPVVSYVPSKPNVRLGIVAGAIAAAFIAFGFAFVRDYFGLQVSRRGRPDVGILGINSATAELR